MLHCALIGDNSDVASVRPLITGESPHKTVLGSKKREPVVHSRRDPVKKIRFCEKQLRDIFKEFKSLKKEIKIDGIFSNSCRVSGTTENFRNFFRLEIFRMKFFLINCLIPKIFSRVFVLQQNQHQY